MKRLKTDKQVEKIFFKVWKKTQLYRLFSAVNRKEKIGQRRKLKDGKKMDAILSMIKKNKSKGRNCV